MSVPKVCAIWLADVSANKQQLHLQLHVKILHFPKLIESSRKKNILIECYIQLMIGDLKTVYYACVNGCKRIFVWKSS